jgi:hypothetical protein
MEQLIRILNDDDQRALAWLTRHVGSARVSAAARHLAAGAGRPAYVSALCRCLGVWPPTPRHAARARQDDTVAGQHLAQIRRILSRRAPGPSTANQTISL